MIKEERYDKIVEILEEKNYVSATFLSKALFVSMPTIRRDLGELSRRGLITRTHGGAKSIDKRHIVLPVDYRKTQNLAIKKALCQKAAKLIKNKDIIFIDASTTASQLDEYIKPELSVTVITNSIPLSLSLKKKGIKVYCTGGEVQENSLCYAGGYAESFVGNFNFDFCFFSCTGVDKNGYIVDVSEIETHLRNATIKTSKKSVFICDSSKFSVSAPYKLMPLSECDYVLSD